MPDSFFFHIIKARITTKTSKKTKMLDVFDSFISTNINNRPAFQNFMSTHFVLIHEKVLPSITKSIVKTLNNMTKSIKEESTKFEEIKTNAPSFLSDNNPRTQLDKLMKYIEIVPKYARFQEFQRLMKSPGVTIQIGDKKANNYNYTYSDMLKAINIGVNDDIKRSLIRTNDNPLRVHLNYDVTNLGFEEYMNHVMQRQNLGKYVNMIQTFLDKNKNALSEFKGDNSSAVLSLSKNQRYLDNLYNIMYTYYVLHESRLNPTYAKKTITYGDNETFDKVENVSKDQIENTFMDTMISDYSDKIDLKKYNFKRLTGRNLHKLRLAIPGLSINFGQK